VVINQKNEGIIHGYGAVISVYPWSDLGARALLQE
jgi:hypothetical protein